MRFVILLLTLAACAPVETHRPLEMRLTNERIRVTLSDRSICRAERPAEGPWGGPLQGCPPGWSYHVEPDPRGIVQNMARGSGLENIFAPLADVTVTGPTGRSWLFRSPPSRNWR